MKTACQAHAIRWHLQNNVSGLSNKTVESIMEDVELFNNGEKHIFSFAGTIGGEEHLSIGELFDELQIEII